MLWILGLRVYRRSYLDVVGEVPQCAAILLLMLKVSRDSMSPAKCCWLQALGVQML